MVYEEEVLKEKVASNGGFRNKIERGKKCMEFSGKQLLSMSTIENTTISVDKAVMDTLVPYIDDSKKIIEQKCKDIQDVNVSYATTYEGISSSSYMRAYDVMMYRQEDIKNQFMLLMELLNNYTEMQCKNNKDADISAGGSRKAKTACRYVL